jgi:hypothetical protein
MHNDWCAPLATFDLLQDTQYAHYQTTTDREEVVSLEKLSLNPDTDYEKNQRLEKSV